MERCGEVVIVSIIVSDVHCFASNHHLPHEQWRKLAPALMSQLLFSSKKANFLHLIEFFAHFLLSPAICFEWQTGAAVEIIVNIHRPTLIRINSLI